MKMDGDMKKVKFGFSKVKKPCLIKPLENTEKVEFVDCFDGAKGEFSFKGTIMQKEIKKELVIEMPGTRTAMDVIKARIGNPKLVECDLKQESEVSLINGDHVETQDLKFEDILSKGTPETLEDIAAKEIIADLSTAQSLDEGKKDFAISQTNEVNTTAASESTLEDYENVPVIEYGLAMLRGMGWRPEKGIGKEERIVKPVAQKLRPKGLGLGADKVVQQDVARDLDLKIDKNGLVKFTSGSNAGKYGIVEGLDEDTGRVIVKLALGGIVSATEAVITPVTKKDYETNAKVLNNFVGRRQIAIVTERLSRSSIYMGQA